MVSGFAFALEAVNGDYIGIPYTSLDCQAFVEKVLYNAGVKKANGSAYNWKGSNSMWRNALSWRGTYQEAINKFGSIPFGAWLFTVKDDGGEKERGYHDDQGNAAHVGIYVGDLGSKPSIHSTTGGVQWADSPAKRWTHVGLCMYLDYGSTTNVCPLCGQEVKKA